jgi:ankyrin repeat protein
MSIANLGKVAESRCPQGCVLCAGGGSRARAAAPAAARRALRAALGDGCGRNVNWAAVAAVAQAKCLARARAGAILSAPLLRAPRELDGPRSALAVAVEEDRPEYVALLLARGADPNAVRVWCDDTPLVICAGFRGNTRVAQLLLAHGAHVDGIGIPVYSSTPTTSSATSSDCSKATTATGDGSTSDISVGDQSSAPSAASSSSDQVAQQAPRRRRRQSRGEAVSEGKANGGSSRKSVRAGDSDAVKSLTALGVAAYRGHVDLVRLLLRHGADVHHVEAVDGCSVLHLVAQGSRAGSNDHMRIAESVLAYGANPAARDLHGNTPSRAAFLAGDQVLAIFLYMHAQARIPHQPMTRHGSAQIPSSSVLTSAMAPSEVSSQTPATFRPLVRPAISKHDVDLFIRAAKRARMS